MAASASTAYSGYNDSVLGQSRTPIHFAALQGQLHALHGLIKGGKSVNSRTMDGVTPLHEACSAGNVYCARMLIKAGAEINARNVDGSTPLCDAACRGSLECINLLLESGATVDDPLARSTPLHEAALRGYVSACLVTSNPAQPLSSFAQLMLHVGPLLLNNPGYATAPDGYQSHAVARLIEAGCNLEASDGHFGTPLHAACYRANVVSALYLLIAGANVNATKLHESPLHVAAAAGSPLLVRILVEFGARLSHRDNNNKRPIDRAKPGSETQRLLWSCGSEVLSLQDTCRVVIYRHIRRGRLKDLSSVGLPVPIIDKLLYRGLWVA